MEKYRILTVLALCLGLCVEAGAQGSRLLRFAEPQQAVDTVRFDGGALTLRYPFENVSGKAVTVLEVHSTCGCFTGEVGKRSLKPGEKAVLTAVFDPKSLYGDQTRHLTVVASDGTDTVLSSVTVKGYVLRDESEGRIRYAEDLGRGLRTDTPVNALTRDRFGDYMFSIPLYNDTDREMTVKVKASRRVKLYAPATIPARSRADLRGEYNPRRKRRGAEVTETLTITVNGAEAKPLQIRGKIQ
jgi:hypothetical protein